MIGRWTIYAAGVVRAAVIAAIAGLASWPGAVHASPSPRQRVVLADPDPELRHAMEQALAPWHLEVVIEGPPPTDAGVARDRADADTARFVVWREGRQLVVYDRELATTERRDSRAGVLDPPTAAAAALTIKTMMRLPPPAASADALAPAPASSGPGLEVRLQAGAATRITRGGDASVTARFGGAAAIRPWPGAGWRVGVAGDSGTATDVSRAGFKGTWSEWSALGFVSWTYARGAWEIEPHAGLGIRSSSLDGTEMTAARSEAATLAMVRGGFWARWRHARLSIGAGFDLDGSFGTPTYTKTGTPAEVFQVPGAGVELGAVVAVDL